MADEAFALSPISARAAQPSEEDYAAISEAFMETSRGRWFLTEYAKRNRNADTRMVLDAVARIEESLAAQKDESLAAQREATAAAADISLNEARLAEARLAEARLAETMAAIRDAVEVAQASASEALDGLALNERLAPVRKGARVLREIAWRLREIGNDSRICDLIDSQVTVIEKASEEVTTEEAKAALGAAFAAIGDRLAESGGNGRAAAPAAQAASRDTPDMPPAATAETVETVAAQEAAEASAMSFAEPVEAEAIEAAAAETANMEALRAEAAHAEAAPAAMPVDTEAALAPADTFGVTEAADIAVTDEAADAHDEAILDMIAMEMGAPDPIDDDEIAEPAHFAEPAPVEQAILVEVPEPVAAVVEPPVEMAPQPAAVAAPAVEMSLGSTILASGMLSKPARPANDPLAPIRRMSQVEKIAFFS